MIVVRGRYVRPYAFVSAFPHVYDAHPVRRSDADVA